MYLLPALLVLAALPQKPPVWKPDLSGDHRAALERISADSLKGNLSFLASDALENCTDDFIKPVFLAGNRKAILGLS